MELTVGQVSAIIAAAVFVFQLIVPNVVTFILVGTLHQTHSAVTWSVVQRHLFSSHWPLLTRSDSTSYRGVDAKVRFIALIKPVGLFLISLAAVVTPLGLHEVVAPSTTPDHVAFGYLADNGPFGYASMVRDGQNFTRWCGDPSVPFPCPGSQTQITDYYIDESGSPRNLSLLPGTTYDVNVPRSIIDLYESGLSTQAASVASFFDIESRLYSYLRVNNTNNGEKYLGEAFKMIQSVILEETVRPIEGLIVDTRNGGIGFRNHSVPEDVDLGAEWMEDILFIEPETECVNLNISFEFSVGDDGTYGKAFYLDTAFVDDGGFVNLDHAEPIPDMSDPQKNPNLRDRAYYAAWLINFYTMLVWNVTSLDPDRFLYLNSTIGKRFPVTDSFTRPASTNSIFTTTLFDTIFTPFDFEYTGNYSTSYNDTNAGDYANSTSGSPYTNPFHLDGQNYSSIRSACAGLDGNSIANITDINIKCGLIVGAARPADGTPIPIVPLPNSRWKQPIYACASANKASIKQVAFHFNTSSVQDISSLTVINVTDKAYPDEASMPRWGVETCPIPINVYDQLWGIISEENADAPNMTSFRAPHLRLPGFSGVVADSFAQQDYVPGYNGPSAALSGIYDLDDLPVDYSGQSNLAMIQRWRQLADSASGTAHIANLIWTDIAANKMTSSKSWSKQSVNSRKRSEPDADSIGHASVPVTKFERRIQYNWTYAVPALIVLALAAIMMLVAIILAILKYSGVHRVRYYIDSLSSGRLLASAQYPGVTDKLAPVKVWVGSVGKYSVSLSPVTRSTYQMDLQRASSVPPAPVQKQEIVPQYTPVQQQSHIVSMYQPRYAYNGYQQAPTTDAW